MSSIMTTHQEVPVMPLLEVAPAKYLSLTLSEKPLSPFRSHGREKVE